MYSQLQINIRSVPIVALIILSIPLTTAYAQETEEQSLWSAGLSYIHAIEIADNSGPDLQGTRLSFERELHPQFAVQANVSYFFAKNIQRSGAMTSSDFSRKGWSTEINGIATLFSKNKLDLYGKAGMINQQLSFKGETTVTDDTRNADSYTYTFEETRAQTAFQTGVGLKVSFAVILFAETSLSFFENPYVNINTGFQLPF